MEIPEQLVAIVVPLAFFACTAFILGAILYARHRERELRHETIRMALDRGQPLPPELLTPPRRRDSDLAKGVKLIFTGGGIAACLALLHVHAWPAGLVVVSIGLGYLASYWLTGSKLGQRAAE